MIDYQTIKTHLTDGLTVEQIVDLYANNMATKNDIDADKLQSLLSLNGLLFLDVLSDTPGWTGYLFGAVKQSGNQQLMQGINLLVNQLQKPNRKIVETTRPEFGALMQAMLSVVDQLPVDAAAIRASVDALSGGRKYGDVTLENINAAIADADRRVIAEQIKAASNRATAAAILALDAGKSFEDIIAAGGAAWSDVG